jgi:hypothetical protein
MKSRAGHPPNTPRTRPSAQFRGPILPFGAAESDVSTEILPSLENHLNTDRWAVASIDWSYYDYRLDAYHARARPPLSDSAAVEPRC